MAPTPKNHFGIRRHRNKQLPPPQGTGYTPISSKQPPFLIPFSFHSQDVVPDLTVFSIVILIMDRIEQKSNCSDVTLPIEISPFYTSPPRWAASEEKYFWRFRKLETAVACCGRRGLTGNGKRRHRRRKNEREGIRHFHAPSPPRDDLGTIRTQFRKSARSSRTLAATSGAWVTSVTIAM